MANNNILLRLCQVLAVGDSQGGLRIKVRLDPEDSDCKDTTELPYCFPLLPKHLHINPKVGECVLVILSTQNNPKGNRFFIGPVISQQYGLNFEPFNFQSRSLLNNPSKVDPFPNPDKNPDNLGTIPNRDDIVLQGRQNCDVVLKNNELRLRCGYKQHPDSTNIDKCLLFNREDLSYIQMKFKSRKDEKDKEYRSSVNIVADRINLLSHDSKNIFTLSDSESLITDESMLKILKEAHRLPYGDLLIDFLKKFIEVFRTHEHPAPQDPPSFNKSEVDFLSQDLTEMLSQSIRIN